MNYRSRFDERRSENVSQSINKEVLDLATGFV